MKLRRGLGLGPIVNWFVSAPRPFGDDASSTNLAHQQRKQVANYVLHRVRFCWVLDVFERLNFYHFRADALQQKLLYLLSDVFEEGCA